MELINKPWLDQPSEHHKVVITVLIHTRDIDTSLCMFQDQHNHSLIIHDKFEDLFTTIT